MYFVLITLPKLEVLRTEDKATAVTLGEKRTGLPIGSVADLMQVPTNVLVKLYNLANSKKPVQKFSDKQTAAERVFPLLETIAAVPASKASKSGKGGKKVAGDKSESGVWGKYAGKVLKALVEVNPRREGTHGHKSFGIILAAGKTGIVYEEFLKAGGRRQDLAWDEARKAVQVGV